MSDYRPVRRSASGEGKYYWVLLNVKSGELAGASGGGRLSPFIYPNKGDASLAGELLTAKRLNPGGLTFKQMAKATRRAAEAVKRDRAFVPHMPAETVAAKPAAKPKRRAPRAKAAKPSKRRARGGYVAPRGSVL